MKLILSLLLISNTTLANQIGEQKQLDKIDTIVEESEKYMQSIENQVNFIKYNQNTIDDYEIKLIVPIITQNNKD